MAQKTNPATKKPQIINTSGLPLKINFDIRGMERLIFLPDYSPGKGLLPTGSVAVFNSEGHEISGEYLGPDIGCGMLLAKFRNPLKDIRYATYSLAGDLQLREGQLGSIGGGNHFINIYEVKDSQVSGIGIGENLVLIHSGSRFEGVRVYNGNFRGDDYLKNHGIAFRFGILNRERLLDLVKKTAKEDVETVLHQIHNSVEFNGERVIYRKGAVKLIPDQLGIIPSSMDGEAILIRGKPAIKQLEYSINHGTGRLISRSESKKNSFDFSEIRSRVYIPHFITNDDLESEHPSCYRTLEEIIPAILPYVEVVGTLKPMAFIN